MKVFRLVGAMLALLAAGCTSDPPRVIVLGLDGMNDDTTLVVLSDHGFELGRFVAPVATYEGEVAAAAGSVEPSAADGAVMEHLRASLGGVYAALGRYDEAERLAPQPANLPVPFERRLPARRQTGRHRRTSESPRARARQRAV